MRARRGILAAFCILMAGGAAPQDGRTEVRKAYEQARAAHQAKDYPAFLAHSRRVAELSPRSTRALYNLACAHALNGARADAISLLDRLAEMGVAFDPAADEDLAGLRDHPDFQAVVAKMAALEARVGESTVAYTLPEKDLLTEGVAYDAGTGAFFVSSVHRRKVVRIAPDGTVRDFAREGEHGLFSALALAADGERRSLWVASEAQPLMTGFRKEDEGRSFVFELDLDTGGLRRRIPPPVAGGHLSDLTVAPSGELYVADPQTGRVYVLRKGKDAFEVLVEPGALGSPQGMALSADGTVLYVADYVSGIARVDLASRAVSLLDAPANSALTGIDGLVLAGDSLVGVQNGLRPHRVVRLRLAPGGHRLESIGVLERGHPAFDEPTLGVVVKGAFYFVANSQYGAFSEGGVPDETKLRPPTILRTPLAWLEVR